MKENINLSEFAMKRFGQNFLKSDYYKQKIIQSMPKNNLQVIEIGPGLGDLTRELLKEKNVIAYEVDKRLCEHLNLEFKDSISKREFELRCGDVLEHWEEDRLIDEDYNLIANLPYYIATTIILKALKDDRCKSILVMVQKEVALKFSAISKDRNFSSLSVLTQRVGEATLCFDVEPEAFIPAPKVTSSVLLIRKSRSEADKNFEDFLKIAFKQPRKKLSKNLSQNFSKDKISEIFDILDINNNLRPHEATTEIYYNLYKRLV